MVYYFELVEISRSGGDAASVERIARPYASVEHANAAALRHLLELKSLPGTLTYRVVDEDGNIAASGDDTIVGI